MNNQTENIDAERAAFEAWANDENSPAGIADLERYKDGYVRVATDMAWAAWQAARRTPSASIGEHGLPEAAQGVKTWFDRAAEEYPGSNPKNWSAVFKTKVMLDEIKDLRTQLASAQQAKEYEQRHAVESEKALAQVQAQLARQSQGNRLLPREVFANDDAYSAYLQEWAAPPLSSEQQAEVAPCEMPGCSGTGKASSVIQLCPEHTADFIDWRKQKEPPCGS